MNLRGIIFTLLMFLLIMTPLKMEIALGDEQSDVKKELQELRKMMETMQKKIDELEERNRALELQAEEREKTIQENA